MSTSSVANLYETLQRLLPNASQIDRSTRATSVAPLANASSASSPPFTNQLSMPAKPFIDINKAFDPKLYENWSFIDLIPLLLQPSPCDEKIEGFIETVASADASIGSDDSNRNVRSVLIDHLIQLRDQRKRNQANIEEYVKVLLQVNEDERQAHQNLRAYEDSLAQEKAVLHQAQQITDQKNQENMTHSSEKDNLLETTKKLLETLLKEKERDKTKRKRERKHSSSYSSRSSSSSSGGHHRSSRRRSKKRHSSHGRSSKSHRRGRSQSRREKSVRNMESQHQQPAVNPYDYMMMAPPAGYAATVAYPAATYNMATPQPPSKKQLTTTYWTNPAPPPRPMTPVKLPPAPPAGTKLLDVRSMYVRCARDEKWSKFMISSLKTADDQEITAVFNELITQDSLIADYNACYVIKALFDATPKDEQRTQILQRLRMQFKNVVASVCGSDLISSVLQKMPEEGVSELTPELRTIVVGTAKNVNGARVLEQIISLGPSDQMKFIADEIVESGVFSLSRHHVGHRLVVAVVKHFQNEDKFRLMREMLPFVEKMAQDQNGQSVLQISLENSTSDLKSQIIKCLSDDFLRLSQQKIASVTMVKCIEYAAKDELNLFVSALLDNYSANPNDRCPLIDFILDKQGCQVFEKLLDRLEELDPLENGRLMNFLQPHMNYIGNLPNLKRITNKFYQHCSSNYPPPNRPMPLMRRNPGPSPQAAPYSNYSGPLDQSNHDEGYYVGNFEPAPYQQQQQQYPVQYAQQSYCNENDQQEDEAPPPPPPPPPPRLNSTTQPQPWMPHQIVGTFEPPSHRMPQPPKKPSTIMQHYPTFPSA